MGPFVSQQELSDRALGPCGGKACVEPLRSVSCFLLTGRASPEGPVPGGEEAGPPELPTSATMVKSALDRPLKEMAPGGGDHTLVLTLWPFRRTVPSCCLTVILLVASPRITFSSKYWEPF